METSPDTDRPTRKEIWVVTGGHTEYTDVAGDCNAETFVKSLPRLARQAGIDLKPIRTLAQQLKQATKDQQPLLEFFMAALLETEVSDIGGAAKAIDRLVTKWPLHDPMRNDVLQMTEALADARNNEFVTFDAVEVSDDDESAEREVS